jgi:hypothetical protein
MVRALTFRNDPKLLSYIAAYEKKLTKNFQINLNLLLKLQSLCERVAADEKTMSATAWVCFVGRMASKPADWQSAPQFVLSRVPFRGKEQKPPWPCRYRIDRIEDELAPCNSSVLLSLHTQKLNGRCARFSRKRCCRQDQ